MVLWHFRKCIYAGNKTNGTKRQYNTMSKLFNETFTDTSVISANGKALRKRIRDGDEKGIKSNRIDVANNRDQKWKKMFDEVTKERKDECMCEIKRDSGRKEHQQTITLLEKLSFETFG